MIKASVLNYVRQRADEAKQLEELHATLKDIAGRDQEIKKGITTVTALKAERGQLDVEIKNAQEHLVALHQEQDAVRDHTAQLRKDADDYSAAKHASAVNTIKAANIHATEIMVNADAVLAHKNEEIIKRGDDLKKVQGDLDAKKKEYDELAAKHGELQRRHDALARGLDALKPSL